MLQIALFAAAIGLIILGVKGFTSEGVQISKTKTLNGTSGKIAGACCIFGGIALIPLFFLMIWAFG